jgi:hypothetical protein
MVLDNELGLGLGIASMDAYSSEIKGVWLFYN